MNAEPAPSSNQRPSGVPDGSDHSRSAASAGADADGSEAQARAVTAMVLQACGDSFSEDVGATLSAVSRRRVAVAVEALRLLRVRRESEYPEETVT